MKVKQKIFDKIIEAYKEASAYEEASDTKLIVLFELLCDEYKIDYNLQYLDAHILNFTDVDTYINDVLELNKERQ